MNGLEHSLQPNAWEQAYLRFETPAQEVHKFKRRLIGLGAANWPREAALVELCCGRGSGLRALHELGYENIAGLDLSPALAARYTGPGRVVVGDCRALPFKSMSRDVLIVQGGLHHLLKLEQDLPMAVREAARVLRPRGRFIVIEPWLTPFLVMVHKGCRIRAARWAWPKLNALATMIEYERETYERWLNQQKLIFQILRESFQPHYCKMAWGKLQFVGSRP